MNPVKSLSIPSITAGFMQEVHGGDKPYTNYLKMLYRTFSYCRSDPALAVEIMTHHNLLPVLFGTY